MIVLLNSLFNSLLVLFMCIFVSPMGQEYLSIIPRQSCSTIPIWTEKFKETIDGFYLYVWLNLHFPLFCFNRIVM